MKANETKFQKIIEGTSQFVVPHFQRPYTWKDKELRILWDDLLALTEDEWHQTSGAQPRHHFIGSIVTMPGVSVPEGITKYLLIDGQQRITSLLLLLAAVRDRAELFGSRIAEEVHDLYLVNRHQEAPDRYKLLPTSAEEVAASDRAAFVGIIDKDTAAPTGGIGDAYGFFSRQLEDWDAAQLDIIKRMVIGRVMLVSIVLDRDDNPYAIFESLNAKGQPLSQADLIRNLFFMRTHTDAHAQIYRDKWLPMETRVGPDNMSEFIRHFLMRDGIVVKQGDVYFELKTRLDRGGEADVRTTLDVLCEFSTYYARLLNTASEESPSIRKRLVNLNRLQATVCYPFLLNVYREYDERRINVEEVCEVLDVIENFLLRRYVCGEMRAELNKIFPGLYRLARLQGSLTRGVREILAIRNYPQDEHFARAMVERPLYGAGDRRERAKYILERLEQSYEHAEAVDFASLTIEHVLPQTLSLSWKGVLGEGWEDGCATWLHTIGNLTLTGYNSELTNDSFAAKKTILQQSHLELNRYFGDAEQWDFDAIHKRGNILAERALVVWRDISPSVSRGEAIVGRVAGRTPAAVSILGQRIPVATWQAVLRETLLQVFALDDATEERAIREFPKLVGRVDARFRAPKLLLGDLFYEGNISADRIYQFCREVALLAGLSYDDYVVELQE